MSYIITSQCISCGSCQNACPTGAIQLSGFRYQIDANLCNKCFGFDRLPLCMAACATNGGYIVEDPEGQGYWKNWFLKIYRLVSCLRPNPPKNKLLRAKAYKLLSMNS